ncbi:MAG: HEAT repeat domain-containing protein [Candidatus Freyarchaeum deiterrae]
MNEQHSTLRDVAVRVVDFLENPLTVRDNPDVTFGEFIFACQVLGFIGDTVAIPTLIKWMKKHGEKSDLPYRYFMKAETDAFIGVGTPSVEPLVELLKSEHSETRKFAAYALGKIGDRKAFSALEVVFNDSSESKLVREVAGRALLQLDSEEASKIVPADLVNPSVDFPEADNDDLELVYQFFGSPDNLGAPSGYEPSMSLYKYVEEAAYEYLHGWHHRWEYDFDLDEFEVLAEELKLPREVVDGVGKFDKPFFLCLCGERLQWGYLDRLSKRRWELEDFEGWHFQTGDVICVYCDNCERYAGLSRGLDDAHKDFTSFRWFYLPRLPKQSELITEEELKAKPPNLIKRIKVRF